MAKRLTIKKMRRYIKLMRFYPPYIGTGIRIVEVNKTATRYVVKMKLRWYNRNIYGTHFGGSLYAMCDPWFAFAASAYFGPNYIIWDKSAVIRYIRPGKSTVVAVFHVSDKRLADMKSQVEREGKMTFTFCTNVENADGSLVAEVEKEIYIRKK